MCLSDFDRDDAYDWHKEAARDVREHARIDREWDDLKERLNIDRNAKPGYEDIPRWELLASDIVIGLATVVAGLVGYGIYMGYTLWL